MLRLITLTTTLVGVFGSAGAQEGPGLECPEGATCRFDSDGHIVTIERDFQADGTVDWRQTFDIRGNPLMMEVDVDSDGVVDMRRILEYDAGFNLVSDALDRDADNVIDQLTTYETLGDGTRLRTVAMMDAGGNPVVETTYDQAGLAISRSLDFDAEGAPHMVESYVYDEEGNRLTTGIDLNTDQRADFFCTHDPPCPPPYDCGIWDCYRFISGSEFPWER